MTSHQLRSKLQPAIPCHLGLPPANFWVIQFQNVLVLESESQTVCIVYERVGGLSEFWVQVLGYCKVPCGRPIFSNISRLTDLLFINTSPVIHIWSQDRLIPMLVCSQCIEPLIVLNSLKAWENWMCFYYNLSTSALLFERKFVCHWFFWDWLVWH